LGSENPRSSQTGGGRYHLSSNAAPAASFNPFPNTRFPANSIAQADGFQIPNQRLANSSRTTLYIEKVQVPTLRHGDIVIMDNLGSHKAKAVRHAIRAVGAGSSTCRNTHPI
jgi:hypothetical protein